MTEEISAIAHAMLGELDQAQETVLSALCRTAEATLRQKLRPGLAPEDCDGCFPTAAALLAVSVFRTVDAHGVTAFDAGAVAIRMVEGGEALSRPAIELLAPWCDKGHSVQFLGVRA